MNIGITMRHQELPEALRSYAAEKAGRLSRFFHNLQKIEMVMDRAGDSRYTAELIVNAPRGKVFVVHATESTATAAVDVVVDKMERQLSRFKERLTDRSAKAQERATRRMLRRQRRCSDSTPTDREDTSGETWW